MKNIFSAFLLLLAMNSLKAQGLKGSVISEKGEAVSFGTVYIASEKIGTATNNEGNFSIKLKPGNYSVEFRALGFQPEKRDIEVKNSYVELKIVLKEQTYSIAQVVVKKGKEDPAYVFMRKAISLAPYYQNQVKHYQSDVYLKGSINFIKIPKLLQNSVQVNNMKIKSGDVFVAESMNKLTFDAPSFYKQKVVSMTSNVEFGNEKDAMGFIKGSFYQSVYNDAISPLSPQAFRFYNFKYMGVTFEGKNSILKIKVEPKFKSQKLFSGYLFLLDKNYSIYSIDFQIEFDYGTVDLKTIYSEIKGDIWLPISHSFFVNAGMFGAKATINYKSSIKYSDVIANTSLPKPVWLKSEKTNISEQHTNDKTMAEADNLMNKEKITNRDMRKISKLFKKKVDSDSTVIKAKETSGAADVVKIEFDSNYRKNDTLFWKEIRPIPLATDELKGYIRSDSMKLMAKKDSLKNDSISKTWTYKAKKVLLGYDNDYKAKNHYDIGGLINPTRVWFNPVDGFVYGWRAYAEINFDSTQRLTFNPTLGYYFGREKIFGTLNTNYYFNTKKNHRIGLEFGSQTEDFAGNKGYNKYINSLSSLFFKRNYSRYYNNSFIKVNYSHNLGTKFYFNTSASFNNRKKLENSTQFSVFKRNSDYDLNVPENYYLSKPDYSFNNQKAFLLNLQLSWASKEIPTYFDGQIGEGQLITLNYQKGIKGILKSEADFDHISLNIFQRIKGELDEDFSYKITAGSFLKVNKIHMTDFYYASTAEVPLNATNTEHSFALLPLYASASPDKYIEAHVHYQTAFLLLKYLPIISFTNYTENIYLGYYNNGSIKNYWEAGYGLGRVLLGTNIGVYAGFKGTKYNSFGARWSLNF